VRAIDPGNKLSYAAAIALLMAVCGLAVNAQQAKTVVAAGTPVIIQPHFGGQILGYDIDRNGTEGILTEFVTEGNNQSKVATEIFDQKTGAITAVVAEEDHTSDDYVAQSINTDNLGLVLFQKSGQNQFLALNPLNGNQFTGDWTPPLAPSEISIAQGDNAAVFASFPDQDVSYVYGSNIAQNTFGPAISLAPIISVDEFLLNPAIAFDSSTNQAVLADSHDCPEPEPQCATNIALVNLTTGAITEFTDKLGVGQVNGLAVDPVKGIAVTTTITDQGVEFYNLAKKKGLEVFMPNPNLAAAGLDVEFDAIHKLFLVSQFSSTGDLANPQPRVYVYNEAGKLKETVTTLQRIGISSNHFVLNTTTRTGFLPVVAPPQYLALQLQSFTY